MLVRARARLRICAHACHRVQSYCSRQTAPPLRSRFVASFYYYSRHGAREGGGAQAGRGWREGGTRRRDAAIRDSGKGRRASVGDGLARARARAHARSGQRNFVIGAPFKPRNSATPGVETGLVVDPAHSCPFLFLFSSVPPSPSFSQFWLLTEN